MLQVALLLKLITNRLLTSAFVLFNGMVFNRSNGWMFDELKEVKYFELTDFKSFKRSKVL